MKVIVHHEGCSLRVRFGDCVFDASTRELKRAGQPVHLPPKAFQLLELLISKRPRAITKAEIRDTLWPATSVGDSSLARVVVDLRSAIGDDARHPRLLRTVHGFGYSFAAETVLEQAPWPRAARSLACRLVRGEREIALVDGRARPRPAPGRQRLDRLHQRVAPSRADPRFRGAGHPRGPRKQERDLPPGNETDGAVRAHGR